MLYAEYITSVNDYEKKPSVAQSLPNSLRGVIPTSLCKERVLLNKFSKKTVFLGDFEEVVFCNISIGSGIGNFKK